MCNQYVQGVPKKVLFRNVAVLLLRGVWAIKIWVFLGAEHIYTITRCLAHVTNVSTLVWAPISPLYTSEWPFDQKFCYFPKEDFFWDTLYIVRVYSLCMYKQIIFKVLLVILSILVTSYCQVFMLTSCCTILHYYH